MNKPLLFKLFRDLKHRFATLITLVLVLSIGVSSYVSMAGVYKDLNHARERYYNDYNLADFTLDLKRAPETIIHQLNNLPNISHLQDRIKTQVMATLPGKSYSHNNVQALPGIVLSLAVPHRDSLNNLILYKGRWFSDSYAREVIVDQQFAKARNLVPGDRIKIRLPDKEHNLLIVGTSYSPEFVLILPPGGMIAPEPGGYAVMYMPYRYLQQSSDLKSSFNQILGTTKEKDITAIKNSMALLTSKLDQYGVELQTAKQDQLSVQALDDELCNIKTITTLFPAMFLLVAALVLNVMINRLVMQQRTVIGTLKAIGYSSFSLIRHYLYYGLAIGLLGGIAGIILGIYLQNAMLNLYKTYFIIPGISLHFYFSNYVIGIIISIFSTLLGSFAGVRKAVKLKPAEAMKPPPPEKAGHILLERFPKYWKALSFTNKMAIRAVFKNKFRSLATIAASMMAMLLVFSSLSFIDSMNKMISFSFNDVQHQDFTLSFRNPLGMEIMQSINILPGVKAVESQLNIPAELMNGPYSKRLGIIGLPRNNYLYTPIDKQNKKISIKGEGLVITKMLAEILHLKKGDFVSIKPLIGDRHIVKAKVEKIIKTYLGLSAYVNQTSLSRLLGDSQVTNTVLINLHKDSDKKALIEQTNRFAPMINLVEQSKAKQMLMETLNRMMSFFITMMIGFASVIAIGSIINTALISLNERERDAASLRILGFSKFQVAKIFFSESLILNATGIFIGIFAGIGYCYYMSTAFSTEMYRMPMVIKGTRIIEAIFIIGIFTLISQAIVYRFIAKIDWFKILNIRE